MVELLGVTVEQTGAEVVPHPHHAGTVERHAGDHRVLQAARAGQVLGELGAPSQYLQRSNNRCV